MTSNTPSGGDVPWRQRLRGARTDAERAAVVEAMITSYRGRLRDHAQRQIDRTPELRLRLDGSDVVQSVYVAAARNARGYLRKPETLDPYVWLRGLVRQELSDQRRRHFNQKRNARRNQALPEGSHGHPVSREPSPSHAAREEEAAGELGSLLTRLSPADRDLVYRAYFHWQTSTEISAALGITKAALAQRLHRAIERFHAILAEHKHKKGADHV